MKTKTGICEGELKPPDVDLLIIEQALVRGVHSMPPIGSHSDMVITMLTVAIQQAESSLVGFICLLAPLLIEHIDELRALSKTWVSCNGEEIMNQIEVVIGIRPPQERNPNEQ